MTAEARRALEAILIVAESPVPAQLLAQLVELPVATVEELLAELAAEYDATDRGFEVVAVAGGWRFQSHGDMAPYVERFVLEGQTARLSAAALETLAIVAYKQPISRAQVAAIRGVNVDGVIRTLDQRGYIAEVARDPGPGQAVLYGTTPRFLERLGIHSIEDLPAVAEFVPGADVVEALEQGLRVDPTPVAGATTDEPSTDDVPADTATESADTATEPADPPVDPPVDPSAPPPVDPPPADPPPLDPPPVDPLAGPVAGEP